MKPRALQFRPVVEYAYRRQRKAYEPVRKLRVVDRKRLARIVVDLVF